MSFEAMRGNKYMELLSTSNKILMNQWKMHSSVQKEYDTISKTYVYNVGGKSPMAQMCIPKDKKQKLKLYFPLLVLQLCFPVKANLLCDIGITLCNNQRKRITLSSNQKSKQNSSLFTVLPFTIENSNKWINILVDIEDIVSTVWNNLKLKEIDFLSLSGAFLLKRIFLLSRDLINVTNGVFAINYNQLPKQMSLPKNITEHYVYVSSTHESFEKSIKAGYLSTADVCNNSTSSSRSSLNNERIRAQKVNPLTLIDESKLTTNFLTKSKNLEKCEMFEDIINLSMLTFSKETEQKAQKEFKSHSLPVQISTGSSSCKNNSNVSVGDNEQDTALWMPLSNKRNDSEKSKDC